MVKPLKIESNAESVDKLLIGDGFPVVLRMVDYPTQGKLSARLMVQCSDDHSKADDQIASDCAVGGTEDPAL